jgi:hypothetical protein
VQRFSQAPRTPGYSHYRPESQPAVLLGRRGAFSEDAILAITALFFAPVPLSASILQAKYTRLLLKLQPDETEYIFYD